MQSTNEIELSAKSVRFFSWDLPLEAFKLAENDVHIWASVNEKSMGYLPKLYKLLSKQECLRAARYRFDRDQRHFIIRHGLLRILLGRYLGVDPQSVRFCHNIYRKPFVEKGCGDDALQFSLSYSNDIVLYAFTRGRRIGVDIEFIQSMPNMDTIVKDFFSLSEINAFYGLPQNRKKAAFFNCWTQKEAFLKAIGDGLFRRLKEFDVSVARHLPAKLIRVAWDPHEANYWLLKMLTSVQGYAAALAVERSHLKLRFR
jgi:4'-phosphopantetheinyl transferase